MRFAGGRVVARAEQTADRRPNAEYRKIAAGHEHALAVDRLLRVGKVRAEDSVSRDPNEDRLRLLEIAEHRVAENGIAVASHVALRLPGLGAGGGEVDQPMGLLHRQGAQQHLVEQRENSGVRADAERQRQDGDQRDERRLEQRSEREFQVGHNG